MQQEAFVFPPTSLLSPVTWQLQAENLLPLRQGAALPSLLFQTASIYMTLQRPTIVNLTLIDRRKSMPSFPPRLLATDGQSIIRIKIPADDRDNTFRQRLLLKLTPSSALQIKDVVGYDALGHCFFTEDGPEERNTFEHCLGLLIKASTLLPSDRDSRMCRDITDGAYPGYVAKPRQDCR